MNRVLSMYSRVLGLSSEKRLVSWLKHLNFLSPRFLLPSIKTTNKYINISLPEKFNPYFYRWSRHEKVITSNFQFQREQAIPLLFVIIFKVLGYQLAKQPKIGFCTAYFTFCLHHWHSQSFSDLPLRALLGTLQLTKSLICFEIIPITSLFFYFPTVCH